MNVDAPISAARDRETVRIMIVDDHEVVRVGLTTLLELEPGFEVVAQASSESEALRVVESARPDVVLMDIRLRGGSGVRACRAIRAQAPQVRVLFLTSYSDARTVQDAASADASGYLLKEVDSEYLVDAIRTVAAGNRLLDSGSIERGAAHAFDPSGEEDAAAAVPLMDLERRMLSLVAEGRSNLEIAAELNLTVEATRNYLTRIYRKLEY